MGVLPLQFVERRCREFDGDETFTILGVADLTPRQEIEVEVTRADGSAFSFAARVPDRYRQRARIFPRTAASSTTCCGNLARGAAA